METIELLMNGAGGAIIGPLVAQLLGGKNSNLVMRVVAGLVGGVGAGVGAEQAGLGALLGSGEAMQLVQSFIEGGVGGGVLATLGGMLMKQKA